MKNFLKSSFIVIAIILLQLAVYTIFIKPIITAWGASPEEIVMPMTGDNDALLVMSTRSILINAPKHEVWQWLMQIGADRKGFYSYEFLESALGYETRYPNLKQPQFPNFMVDDIVRGSMDENKSILPYNFKVLYINPENTFVLENWGTFLLKGINAQQTRLVIRTQVVRSPYLTVTLGNYLFAPFHFIMERRMMLGIKSWVEHDTEYLSTLEDVLWFINLILSWFLICFSIFWQRGVIKSFIVPLALSILWELTIFLLNPIPLYSGCLLVIICFSIFFRTTSKTV